MNTGRQRLWLALRLRDLPLAVLDADIADGEAVAIVDQRRLVYCNAAARALGAQRGMKASSAQLLGNCRLLPRNPDKEEAALRQLRDHLYCLTPHIHIHRSQQVHHAGLLLEIASCLRLFSGARQLGALAIDRLADCGHSAALGLGHTEGAAWLLSFTRHGISGDETPAVFTERLNRLPVQALYDHPEAVEALTQMGFTTLGDVARQINATAMASLSKRLGRAFTTTLAELYDIGGDFGQASLFGQPVITYLPEEHFQQGIQFDYPVTQVTHLQPAFEQLLQSLNDFLRLRQLACQHIQWRISDIHRRSDTLDVVSDLPQSSWQLLYDLTLIRFDSRPIPFEVDSLELRCLNPQPRQGTSQRLDFNGEGRQRGTPGELAVTLAKLKARLGDAAVHKVSYRDSLLPEQSQATIAVADTADQQLPDIHRHGLRPNWLFPEPQPVEWRHRRLYWRGYLTLAAGPERLTSQWWQQGVARDYYLARRQDNVALWVYQDLSSRLWYVHGVFS